MPKKTRMNAEERREANARYARAYRERNPDYSSRNNRKVVEAPSIQCECGGFYKDAKQTKRTHIQSIKHECWKEKQRIINMFIEAGQHSDKEESNTRIDALCCKKGYYTNKSKLILYGRMKAQLQKKLNRTEEEIKQESEEEEEKEEKKVVKRPFGLSHAEKIIQLSTQQKEEQESDEEPKNIIMEVSETDSSSSCASTTEEESGTSQTSEEESEGEDTEEPNETSTDEDGEEYLQREKQRAKARFERYKAVPVAETCGSPPPNDETEEEEEDKDPYGDKYLETLFQDPRFKKKGDSFFFV